MKTIHLTMIAHAAILAAFAVLVLAASSHHTSAAPAVAACDTDSDCAAKFGGDGGPRPALAQ